MLSNVKGRASIAVALLAAILLGLFAVLNLVGSGAAEATSSAAGGAPTSVTLSTRGGIQRDPDPAHPHCPGEGRRWKSCIGVPSRMVA